MSEREELMALRRLAELEAKAGAKAPEKTSTLPANAGLANFAASVAGLPMDTLTSAYNLFKSGMGVAQHKLLGTEPPELTKGLPGSSESIRNLLRSTGQPGLSPDNPSQTPVGRAQFDLMSRGGFVPGGAIPAVGSMVAEKVGGPEWAGVGALLPQAAITGYNAVRAPSLARQEAQNAVRDKTFSDGREAGFVVPPSAAGGGSVSNVLESFGGKAAMGQKAAIKNQEAMNVLARKELGLPKMSPLSVETLKNLRDKLASPYREVAKIDQEAATALEKLKQVRFDANAQHKFYNHTPNPEVLAKAKALDTEAARLESYLEGIAANAGKANLVSELRDARKQIAKTYDVERALNVGTGDVSAPTLGRMVDQGKPLSGGLGVAGRFQQAFPHFMREGQKVPSPDVSATNLMASGMLGYGGFQTMGLPGTLMAGLPFLRGGARSALLSGPAQNALLPSYNPALTPAPSPQLLYQLGILEQQ